MFYLLLTLHVGLCCVLIGLVLIQQGKGADAGATFGGGGNNTVLGAGGAADFITKGTTSIAIAFMVTSILLARSYANGGVPTTSVKSVDPLAGSVMEAVAAPAEESAPEAAAPVANDDAAETTEEPAAPAAATKEAANEETTDASQKKE